MCLVSQDSLDGLLRVTDRQQILAHRHHQAGLRAQALVVPHGK
jgi:hypothetical protein